MFRKINFWKKVGFFLLLFLTGFLFFIYPLSKRIAHRMVYRTMQNISETLVDKIQKQKEISGMIQILKEEEMHIFFYMTLVDEEIHRIFDTRLLKGREKSTLVDSKERHGISRALRKGKSSGLKDKNQDWRYAAFRFYFQKKPYILMLSLSSSQMKMWIEPFYTGIFALNVCILTLFAALTVWIISKLTRPLFDIVQAVKPFSLNKTNLLSPIPLKRNMSPEFKHIISTLNSLSEKLKEQSRLLVDERHEKESILEALIEGVIGVDRHGKIRFANYTGANMLGSPRRQLIGKDFVPAPNHPKLQLFQRCQHILHLAIEQEDIVTDSLTMGDAQKIYLDLIAVPKPFRNGALLILQDKSSQYKIVEMGKDFIANASHELRTPITIIKGYAETLQDLPTISKPMLCEITEKIARNCLRMDNLVRNLLILADVEYIPESKFQLCDIVALADNCKHLLSTLQPSTRIDIEKSSDKILAEASPDLLELALMNLLENGVKYSTKPAHLTLYLKEQGDEILIAVQDRGMGIPKEDLPHIFDRFYTVDKTHSRRLGGAGLGLSIVKTIIEKHEGTVSVSSVIGQGTTFTVQIPAHRHAFSSAGK